MNLNEFFGKVYCINLDRRLDRWEQVSTTFPDINIDRVSAVDGVNSSFKHPRLMPSEIGCTMSHINVLKTFMDTNDAPIQKLDTGFQAALAFVICMAGLLLTGLIGGAYEYIYSIIHL